VNDEKLQASTPELNLISLNIAQLTTSQNRNDALIRNMAEQYALLTKEMTVLTKEHTEFVIEARHTNKESAEIRKLVEKSLADTQQVILENVSIRANLGLLKWLLGGVSIVGLALFGVVIAWFKP
jgi:hypothetical protein